MESSFESRLASQQPFGIDEALSEGMVGLQGKAASAADLDQGGDGCGVTAVGGVHKRRAALVQVRLLHGRVIPDRSLHT
jgi:hypothetical protein